MKKLMIITALFISISAFGQSDKDKVERACLNYVESIYEMDTAKLKSVSRNLYKRGYYFSKNDERWSVSPMTYEGLVSTALNYNKKGLIPENAPKKVAILDISERVANVKLEAFWGFDYLLLTKNDEGQWQISQVLWQSYTPEEYKRMIAELKESEG